MQHRLGGFKLKGLDLQPNVLLYFLARIHVVCGYICNQVPSHEPSTLFCILAVWIHLPAASTWGPEGRLHGQDKWNHAGCVWPGSAWQNTNGVFQDDRKQRSRLRRKHWRKRQAVWDDLRGRPKQWKGFALISLKREEEGLKSPGWDLAEAKKKKHIQVVV